MSKIPKEILDKIEHRNKPQFPISFGDGAYLCPNCKRNNFYYGTEMLHMERHCSYCGQKLDWSEEYGENI